MSGGREVATQCDDVGRLHVGTQCNMYLLHPIKTTSRGVTARPLVRNVGTQFLHVSQTATFGAQTPIIRTKTVASQFDNRPTMTTTKSSSTQSINVVRRTAGTQSTTATKTVSLQTPSLKKQETTTKTRQTGFQTTQDAPPKPTTSGDGKQSKSVQCCLVMKELCVKASQTVPMTSKSRAVQCGGDVSDVEGTCLEQAIYVLRSTPEFRILSYEVKKYPKGQVLIMSRPDLLGMYDNQLEPIRVTLDQRGVCTINQLFVPLKVLNLIQTPNELNIGDFMDAIRPVCSESLVMCPGINKELVDLLSTKVVTTTIPILRHQSRKCVVWQEKTEAARTVKTQSMCLHCRYTSTLISRSRKRKSLETPTRKHQRRLITSNYSYKKLTPVSKKVRLRRLKTARHHAKSKLTKLENIMKAKEMTLNNEQSVQMTDIVDTINRNHQSVLEDVINSTDTDESRKQILKDTWERDSEERKKQEKSKFFKDQSLNKLGDRSNKWSSVTYRIALAVYCRSPAAYNALKSFEILKLPSVRSLQGKTSKLADSPGINHAYLKEQSEHYKEFKEEKRAKGEKVPFGEGVLIFDEVKVIDKIMWNSKNHEFIGLAMTPEDFPYLNDIFLEETDKEDATPQAAKYILQFVWRDLASKFDVIGPYFSCLGSLEHKFILGCMFETMRVFHAYDFKVKCLVCDGASENLALIKSTMKHQGVFGFNKLEDGSFDFSIKPYFENPFLPGYICYWIICPSHQLKNMISALHSSRGKGPKDFTRNGQSIGWEQIKNVKSRENDRFEHGQVRFVPGLLQSYIIRDSWTRLNVKPSKIMQQEAFLAELFSHSEAGRPDSGSALETYKFLRACNQLFENGFLTKQKVDSLQSAPVESILEGYKYFEDWLREILSQDPDYQLNAPKQTQFLAWQTWDLLRICVFGVLGLVEDFLQSNPDYFLVLGRINGSVVESLFSQFKYATGSKLSSINYAQARRSVIMKSNVQGSHSSNKEYRDVTLNIREQDL